MNDILQYKNYYGSVHFSVSDEVFHGKALGINDLVNFEGTLVKELKAAFEEAVEDYNDTPVTKLVNRRIKHTRVHLMFVSLRPCIKRLQHLRRLTTSH